MRKVFLSTAALAVSSLMLHGVSACELNREGNQPAFAILAGACGGLNCLVKPQDALPLPTDEATPPDALQNFCAAYFDPDTYSGSNGLIGWLIATLGEESQYRLGAGFAPSPMDANAQYR